MRKIALSIFSLILLNILVQTTLSRFQGFQSGLRSFYPSQTQMPLSFNSYSAQPFTILYNQPFQNQPFALIAPLACQMRSYQNQNDRQLFKIKIYIKSIAQNKLEAVIQSSSDRIYSLKTSYLIINKQIWTDEGIYLPNKVQQKFESDRTLSLEHQKSIKIKQMVLGNQSKVSTESKEYSLAIPFDSNQYKVYIFINELAITSQKYYLLNLTISQKLSLIQIIYEHNELGILKTFPCYQLLFKEQTAGKNQLSFKNHHMTLTKNYQLINSNLGIFIGIQGLYLQESFQQINFNIKTDQYLFYAQSSKFDEKQASFTYLIIQLNQKPRSSQLQSTRLLITCASPTYVTTYENYWTTWVDPVNKNVQTCQPCPTGCFSCTYCSTCYRSVNCTLCRSGFNFGKFSYNKYNQYVCTCPSGSYPNATTNTCTSCSLVIPNCASCKSYGSGHYSATCATCITGFFAVANSGSWGGYTSCAKCASGCSSCANTTSCSSCGPGLTKTNGICYCASGLFYSTISSTCTSCTLAIPGCTSCVAASTTTTCSACSTGFYVSSNGTCSACSSNCNSCTNTSCTSCTSPFIVSGSSCVCNATASMFLNTTSNACVTCTTFFPSCALCVDNGTISCSTCTSGTFMNGSSCISCPSSCTTCSSLAACLTCVSNLIVINGSCTCDTGNNSYLNTLTTTCFTCSQILSQCASCDYNSTSSSVACLTCNAGYYLANDTTCSTCPTTCSNCTDPLICGDCVPGYQLNNMTFQCECINCTVCSLANLTNCSLCETNGTSICTQCIVGSYLDNSSTCQTCPIGCATCNSSTVCLSCVSPFIPSNPFGECVCNSLLLSYYNPITQTCDSCSGIITNCTSCSTSNYVTTCLSCQLDQFISNNTCQTCPYPCTTCSSSTVCSTCTATYVLINNTCTCDNSSQIFFNNLTNLCSSCVSLTTSQCLACSIDPLATNSSGIKCSSCSVGFFPDSTTFLCSSCPSTCTACTDLLTCTQCQDTFTQNAGICFCDTTTGFYHYGQKCLPCFSIINYCQGCQNSTGTILCTSCGQGTYLSVNNDSCVLCPVNCDVCNSTGCTQCTLGYNLNGNGVCECSTTCVNFTTADASCVDCNLLVNATDNTSTLQCFSCKSKTFLVSNESCNACPDACATCTDYVTCKTCTAGFTLIDNNCVCNNYFNEVQISAVCFNCIQLIVGCFSCTYISGATTCTSCIEGWQVYNGSCVLCGSGCLQCTVASGLPTCTVCDSDFTLSSGSCTNTTACDNSIGLYYEINNATCSSCMDHCQVCYAFDSCVTCQPSFYYLKGKCVCANGRNFYLNKILGTCILCQSALDNSSNLYLANCDLCQQSTANYANGIECLDCADGFYLSAGTCLPCLSGCQKCTGNTTCCSCSAPAWIMNNGVCVCDNQKNYFDDGNSSCLTCTLTNCTVCSNLTTCLMCTLDSFVNSLGVCQPTICGNSVVQGIQTCDDGSLTDGDGCSSTCQVQSFYFCNNLVSPSVCSYDNRFNVQISEILASCNKITLKFRIYPFYDQYNSANYDNFMRSYNMNSSTFTQVTQQNDIVSYQFTYIQNIQGINVSFVFEPSALNINQTSTFPLNHLSFQIVPNNNVLALYYQPDTCDSMQSLKQATEAIVYISYGTLLLSALPCKIVGLELFGVIQLAFMSLGSMDNVNVLMIPMMDMKSVNGYAMDLGEDSSKQRLLQTSQSVTPQRLNSIGYKANFLRNCNVMLILVVSIILIAFILYIITYLFKSCSLTLHSISKRLIKEVLLTLILFNCLNFAYSVGLHFRYATSDDSLYLLGTVAAVATLVMPVFMAIALSMSEEDGFGQFKDKFKKGCVEKAYFVITIIYRMSLGLYMSTSNEDELSTLLVMAFSIFFLLYNLVNLPYAKAYHNYRANVCHFTQFICLFVTMYYRSMKSSSSSESVAKISSPVYLQYTCIFISLVVSLIVLIYEIYIWIKECMAKKQDNKRKVADINISEAEIGEQKKLDPNSRSQEDKLPQLFSNAYDEYD